MVDDERPTLAMKGLCDRLVNVTNGMPPFEFLFKRSQDWWLMRCCEKHECFLIDACIPVLINAANRYANDANRIFDITKALGRLMTVLKEENQSLSAPMEALLLDFVCKFWDYVMEFVCHQCVHIFDMLIRLHGSRCEWSGPVGSSGDDCAWITHLTDLLMDDSTSCRSRFRCLLIFLKHYPSTIEQLSDEFICSLYELVGNATLAVVASELIVYDLSKSFLNKKRCSLHIRLLKDALCTANQQLRTGARERLIPILCKDGQLAKWLIDEFAIHLSDDICDDTKLDAVLSLSRFCIFHQRVFGDYHRWEDFIDERRLGRALLHSQSLVSTFKYQNKIERFYFLIFWFNNSIKVPNSSFSEFHNFFKTTSDFLKLPNTRHEEILIVGLVNLVGGKISLANSAFFIVVILKKIENEKGKMRCYADFIIWLRDICFESLENGANFNRRVMALHMIDYIFIQPFLKTDDKDLFYQLVIPRLRLGKHHHLRLLHCLDDSYQLCQALALDLLTSDCCHNDIDMGAFLEESKSRMISISSNNITSSSYRIHYFLRKEPSKIGSLFEYLFELCADRVRLVTEGLLTITTENGSLHPILNAIATVLEYVEWKALSIFETQWWHSHVCERLLPLCFKVGELVAPVVHNMSPEGFAPDTLLNFKVGELVAPVVHNMSPEGFAPDTLLNFKDDSHAEMTSLIETSQLLLVGCWRAHRHISSILHLIASRVPYPEMISAVELRHIGDYYCLQLTECKHCGAFELAVEGFEGLCTRLWMLEKAHETRGDSALPSPTNWLDDIVAAIKGDAGADKLCSTRRSAGLPHLVCAILGTEPRSQNSRCLRKALDSLLSYEHLSPQLQVHCINVLRSVFGDKRLSEVVLCGLERALRACLLGITSPHWPVRNAVSQLFAVLLVRIFGVPRIAQRTLRVHDKNRMSAYEFFSRFPSLYHLLYSQLSAFAGVSSEFGVFPVLILLTHLFPSAQHARDYPIAIFILPILRILFECKGEKLRELAAYTIFAISDEQDAALLLNWIATQRLNNARQNHIRSVLLMLQMANERFENSRLRNDVKTIVDEIVAEKLYRSWCDSNTAILVSLLNDYGIRPSLSDIELLATIHKFGWLTIRPLAALLAKLLTEKALNDISGRMVEVSDLLKTNRRLRLELWRAFVKISLQTYIDMKLLRMAANDLRDCDEYIMQSILWLLFDNAEVVLRDEECLGLMACFMEELDGGNISLRTEICEDLIHLLNMKLHLTNIDLNWISNRAQRESIESKRIALRGLLVACESGLSTEKILEVGAALLQDEELVVREESAAILSGIVQPGDLRSPLNAQVVLWLIVERFPSLGDVIFRQAIVPETSDNRLFDACVLNPYVENNPIGIQHFDVLETVGLKRIRS
ncbi:Thyroid adenoma-associated -like protein [Toxocara canis]|uniref:tRNA (32-2'-O)-methyltransferase regulator THADA n=1 Tax=Toxocara canis TaxID=6265 RepID=A0A0B2UW22_TOXCA|nr:Thyroid adenoma-associated -like protein [Toxocara canis]